jgi:hypothetical protein
LRGCLLCLLVLLFSSYSTANNTTVVAVHYAEADEIAAALDGLVESGGSIRVYQNQLIINASPGNTAELKGIIEILDESPRKLLISVKSPTQYTGNNGVFKVSGGSGNGHNRTVVNADGTVTQTTVKLSSYSRGVSANSGAAQSIQALEGHDAYIRVAQSAAVSSGLYGSSTQVSAQQGFWVNARVHGQQVMVSLNARNDSVEQQQLNTASVDTRIQGKLGQWLAIGSLSGAHGKSDRAIASHAWNSRSSASVVYVKVELLD